MYRCAHIFECIYAYHAFFASFGNSMTSICAYFSYTTPGSRRPPCTARACRLLDSGVPAQLTSSGCAGPRTVPCRSAPTNLLATFDFHLLLFTFLDVLPHGSGNNISIFTFHFPFFALHFSLFTFLSSRSTFTFHFSLFTFHFAL